MKRNLTYTFLAILILGCSSSGKNDHEDNAKQQSTEAKEVTAPAASDSLSSTPVLGLDISHFQGDVNWEQIKADKLTYAYTKATQGETYKDPNFERNISGANGAGLPIGAYHFYVAADNSENQAEHFVTSISQVDVGDLPPVLDLEQGGVSGTLDKDQFQADVLKWLTLVEEKLGVRPVVYTNNPFANEYLLDPKFSDYHLWIAEYTAAEAPKIPEAWKEKGWLMWQRSQRGTYTGVQGQNVDHDIFNGSDEQLKKLQQRR